MGGNELPSTERRDTPHSAAHADDAPSYSRDDLVAISKILMQLKSSNSDIIALKEDSARSQTESAFATAFRIKREMSYALPLSHSSLYRKSTFPVVAIE